ncbi:MAG TPA: hypothetical protein VJ044_19465 [Candidatus Hodarchaeales archaeon]|nr:hypothetical protein [Candidatus Hodarchaeales archaeon]
MEKAFINIHSFVDIITNSSTELFVCDTDKSVEVVEDLINEIQDKYPNEYGHRLSVKLADEYELGYYLDINDEEAIERLRRREYKIEEPERKSTYISISAERGGLDPRVMDFINTTFNVVFYTTEA